MLKRHLLTIFTYGTHFGRSHQMAPSRVRRDQIIHLSHRHTLPSPTWMLLQRDIINRFHRFTLPRYWRFDEKRAAADNCVAERESAGRRNISSNFLAWVWWHYLSSYGSDLYILLFSHLCRHYWNVGAIYIPGYSHAPNQSTIKAHHALHADTRAKASPSLVCLVPTSWALNSCHVSATGRDCGSIAQTDAL